MEKRRFVHEFALLFLIALAIGVIILQSNLRMTGNVVSNGVSCDGNWTCTDWTTCADGNQSRSCTLDVNSNSTNCVSPVTELQSCTIPVTNSTNSTDTNLTISETNSTNVILSSISITSPATKLSYLVGEPLDINGLVVTGTYSNSSTIPETISTSDITGFDSTSPITNQILTITIGTLTLNYSVDITAASCTESWSCGDWNNCFDGIQTRTCTDANSCGTTVDKLPTQQNCTDTSDTTQNNLPQVTAEVTQPVTTCTLNWQCGDWQECIEGNQARACTDTNNCGTQEGMPATSQVCTVAVINETKPTKKNFFSMVGSVVQGPISAVETFLKNKTNVFIALGALAFVVCGFFAFRFFRKHKLKIVKQ